MKRLLAAAAGLLGIAWWKRRTTQPQAQPDPADELRAKLAEARDADDRDEFEAGETPVNEVLDDVETRRSAVHERARQHTEDLQAE
ncbi:MAG TPA: hypothetical protein VGK79_07980 [Gaiellaceae bacterium]|jgi:hypothetical protein